MNLPARVAVQWQRISGGLNPKTMAVCRRVANKLASRTPALLKGPDWERKFLTAIVTELKAGGIDPTRRPPLDAACAKTEAAATAKEKAARTDIDKLRDLQERLVKVLELRADCALFGRTP